MDMNSQKTGINHPVLFCIFSLAAGAINGFLGTGGGIVLIYTLSLLTENEKKDNFATTLCAVVPMSMVSLFAYSKSGNIDTYMAKTLILPAIAGGILGALLTDKVRSEYLSVAFALLVVYSGASMVMK